MSPGILWPLLSGTQLLISHFVHQNFILAPPLFMSTCHICPTCCMSTFYGSYVVCQHVITGPTCCMSICHYRSYVVCQHVIIGPTCCMSTCLYKSHMLQPPYCKSMSRFYSSPTPPPCCSQYVIKGPHVVCQFESFQVPMSLQVPKVVCQHFVLGP